MFSLMLHDLLHHSLNELVPLIIHLSILLFLFCSLESHPQTLASSVKIFIICSCIICNFIFAQITFRHYLSCSFFAKCSSSSLAPTSPNLLRQIAGCVASAAGAADRARRSSLFGKWARQFALHRSVCLEGGLARRRPPGGHHGVDE